MLGRDQRKSTHQSSTKVVRNSAVDLISRFHVDNNLAVDSNNLAFVTVSEFKDEKYLERFSNCLKLLRN